MLKDSGVKSVVLCDIFMSGRGNKLGRREYLENVLNSVLECLEWISVVILSAIVFSTRSLVDLNFLLFYLLYIYVFDRGTLYSYRPCRTSSQ